MRAELISISAASRLTGKCRNTIERAARSLGFKHGPKGSKLYDANELMEQLYLGYTNATYWEQEATLKWQQKNGFEFPPIEEDQDEDDREPEDVNG